MNAKLQTAAIEVIKNNDYGNYTVPTKGLYPFQWNWDSGFTALGFAHFDFPRAWKEIETLLAGQWKNGMVPHILFWQDDEGYFPNKERWNSNTDPASSGYSQPPVLSSIVLALIELGAEDDLEIAANLVDKLFLYHQWLHVNRDPKQTGLVATFHPWETGRDNCPEWDEGLKAVNVSKQVEYQRRDLDHADQDHRPTKWFYDRYIALMDYCCEHNWDDNYIYHNTDFLYCDVGIQFILMRADYDLITVIKLLITQGKLNDSYNEKINQLEHWLSNSQLAVDKLFCEKSNTYCSLNLRTNNLSSSFSSASALAWYARVINQNNLNKQLVTINQLSTKVNYIVPSWHPADENFEAKRYWRGPVWAIMNYMIAKGLAENHQLDLATKIKEDTANLIERSGFCEYYDPHTAEGLGGSGFSWTAAIYLTLLKEKESL